MKRIQTYNFFKAGNGLLTKAVLFTTILIVLALLTTNTLHAQTNAITGLEVKKLVVPQEEQQQLYVTFQVVNTSNLSKVDVYLGNLPNGDDVHKLSFDITEKDGKYYTVSAQGTEEVINGKISLLFSLPAGTGDSYKYISACGYDNNGTKTNYLSIPKAN